MAIVINGSGTVTGISVGGLPDGIVDAGTLATNSVDSAELIDGAIDASHLASDSVDSNKIASDSITNAMMRDDAVGVAELSATGTASSSTFLRGDNAWSTSGITVADIWHVTPDFTGNADPVVNWTRTSVGTVGKIGNAMTYSTGVFTFPSTGYYLVGFKMAGYINGDTRQKEIRIRTTSDNSSYTTVSSGDMFMQQTQSSNCHSSAYTQTILDITDTTTHKVRFATVSTNNSHYSYTHEYRTQATFIRLGDT